MEDNSKQDDLEQDAIWDVLWLNVHAATMAEKGGYGVIRDAALGIRDGRIAWIGKAEQLPPARERLAHKLLDGQGGWLTPGLIDCHTHLVYGGNRADEFACRMEGRSYAEIAAAGGGILSTVRATRAATEETLLASAGKRLESLLTEGVTTVEIKSGYGLERGHEIKMLQVAHRLEEYYPVSVCGTFLGAHAVPPEFAGDPEGYIDYLCAMLPEIAQNRLAEAVDGFCETIAFSPQHMETYFSAARRLGLKIKLHAGQLSDLGGAALAARYGALSADHLEYVSEEGIRAMAEAGTVAVLLPGAFYMLRETHKPPVERLRALGVDIALATDCNPGTSPTCSLLLMLNMGCVLFGLTPQEALAGITRNAARALGKETEIGTLEIGKVADVALWDIAAPDELSYNIGFNPCLGVMKQGVYRKTKGGFHAGDQA